MWSIRGRLTSAYAAAMMATLVLYSLTLLSVRRTTLMNALHQRVAAEADQVVRAVSLARSSGMEAVIAEDDPLAVRRVSIRMTLFLSLLEGYVLVQDSSGYDIYASPSVQSLSVEGRETFSRAARNDVPNGTTRLVVTRDDDVLLAAREAPLGKDSHYRVFAGLSTSSVSYTPRDLVSTMLVIAPLLLGVSLTFAYIIAGRSFRPIDRLVDQAEAISDGRSLHRRLNIGAAGQELARLAGTLNEMIGRLETTFGALRRFTADASHELKTPLAVMRVDVERAMSSTASANDKAIALEEALEQVTRMADLVDSLLTLARADEGRFDLFREPVPLAPVVREVVETARLLGEDAELEIDAPHIEEAEVLGDLTRLRQLMLNLVTNAIKYTPRGGHVTIALIRGEEVVSLTVEDTGIGIAAADLPYVFERFWRADRVRSRASERGGFGLGLAICQWIAQAHGGQLTVQSRLGRGSTFTVTLPLAGAPGSGMTGEYPATMPDESIESS
ncbi:MAG: HAMP domain-containing histidine kinase [Gemmatimonadaceae bacterium]|nr:HAMP domain-containing histidine kinase [Gemmatimonadaceae bacterium]